ncbi:AP2-like ethylene-responsive transcription factor AIL5 [Apostasia shenzhenica]|uniref:AP2-like ethylene-responsive transcription factor AIL5 n=1 Tax=Apostasia shenzhenica TaxID=1088818 RepID=A0A2I0A350_9ASPA|nr:AP2-like ethylene-responsive transcription factor AIL5 [Apostasia shenzhenica]
MAAGMGWLGFSLPKDSGDRHLHGDGVPLLPLLSDGSGCSLIMEQDWSCRNNPRLDDYSDRPEENHNNESILHHPHRIFQTDQAESVKPQFLVPSLSSISPMHTFSSDGSSMISELKSWLRKNPPFPSEDRSAVSISQDLSSEDGRCRSTAAKPIARKPMDHLGQRTSKFRGVTRHRWTGRYEAHLWDNSCRKEGQARKGRQGVL